jgi:spore cortex biosynthesis protein YabQ
VSIAVQFQTVLVMSACGVLMGMGYDTYHVFTGKSRFPAWLVFFLDVLFWLGSMGLVFFILVKVNDGIVRFPIFIGILFGAWVYFVIGSKKYIQFLMGVIKFCKWLYRTILRVIDILVIRPILFIYSLVFMLLAFLYSVVMTVLGFGWKLVRFAASPFARWGQHLGKKMYRKSTGFWTNWKNWFHSKKKQE